MTRASNAVLMLVFGSLTACHTPSPSPVANQIQWNKLGSEVKVIGPLGPPLGEIITIDASLVSGSVIDSKAFESITALFVEAVNGKPLDRPVPILWTPGFQVKVPGNWYWPGAHVRVVGFQNGGFSGIVPGEAELGSLRADFSWHFQSRFEVLKVLDN